MAEFYINTETVASQSARLTETGNSVSNVQTRVAGIVNGLEGIGLGQAAPAVVALEGRLARHVGKMNALSSALGRSMLKYVAAESDIMGVPVLLNSDYYSVAGTAAGVSNAEADGSVNVGLYDAEGNFVPSVGVGARAETMSAQVTALGISVGGSMPVRFTGIGTDAFTFDVEYNGTGLLDSAVAGVSSVKDAVFDFMGWDSWLEAGLAVTGMPYCEVEPLMVSLDYGKPNKFSPAYMNHEYGSSDYIYIGSSGGFGDSFWNNVADIAGEATWGAFVNHMGFKGWAAEAIVETHFEWQLSEEIKPPKS